jgi:hypothetical protein
MNEHWIDAMTRQFAAGLGRRAFTLGPVAAVVGGALLPSPALACKKVGKKCDKSKDCCDGAKCKGGKHSTCKCKSGLKECSGKCYDLDSDDSHCGACNTVCVFPFGCFSGECVPIA